MRVAFVQGANEIWIAGFLSAQLSIKWANKGGEIYPFWPQTTVCKATKRPADRAEGATHHVKYFHVLLNSIGNSSQPLSPLPHPSKPILPLPPTPPPPFPMLGCHWNNSPSNRKEPGFTGSQLKKLRKQRF